MMTMRAEAQQMHPYTQDGDNRPIVASGKERERGQTGGAASSQQPVMVPMHNFFGASSQTEETPISMPKATTLVSAVESFQPTAPPSSAPFPGSATGFSAGVEGGGGGGGSTFHLQASRPSRSYPPTSNPPTSYSSTSHPPTLYPPISHPQTLPPQTFPPSHSTAPKLTQVSSQTTTTPDLAMAAHWFPPSQTVDNRNANLFASMEVPQELPATEHQMGRISGIPLHPPNEQTVMGPPPNLPPLSLSSEAQHSTTGGFNFQELPSSSIILPSSEAFERLSSISGSSLDLNAGAIVGGERIQCTRCHHLTDPQAPFCGRCGLELSNAPPLFMTPSNISGAIGSTQGAIASASTMPIQPQSVLASSRPVMPSSSSIHAVPLTRTGTMDSVLSGHFSQAPSTLSTAAHQQRQGTASMVAVGSASQPFLTGLSSGHPPLVSHALPPQRSMGHPQWSRHSTTEALKSTSNTAADLAAVRLERRACPVFCFGFGGMVFATFPITQMRFAVGMAAGTAHYRPGSMYQFSVTGLNGVGEQLVSPILSSLDGLPFIDRFVKGKDLSRLVSSWLPNGASPRNGREPLLKLLLLMLQHKGGIAAAGEDVLRKILLPDPLPDLPDATGIISPLSSSLASPQQVSSASPKVSQELLKLLLRGDRENAVLLAVSQKLWAHALLIASHVDRETYCAAVCEFAKGSFPPGHPLRMIYLLFAGQGPLAGVELQQEHLNVKAIWTWCLVTILANRTPDDHVTIVALGDALLRAGEVAAAHVCYLLSDNVNLLSGPDSPTGRVVLLGCDHERHPQRFYQDWANFRLTEVLEYALNQASGGRFYIAHLQAYKLINAYYFADLGLLGLAAKYCEVLDEILRTYPSPSPYLHHHLLERLRQLQDRIMRHSDSTLAVGSGGLSFTSATSGGTTEGRWLSKMPLGGLLEAFDRGLTKVIGVSTTEEELRATFSPPAQPEIHQEKAPSPSEPSSALPIPMYRPQMASPVDGGAISLHATSIQATDTRSTARQITSPPHVSPSPMAQQAQFYTQISPQQSMPPPALGQFDHSHAQPHPVTFSPQPAKDQTGSYHYQQQSQPQYYPPEMHSQVPIQSAPFESLSIASGLSFTPQATPSQSPAPPTASIISPAKSPPSSSTAHPEQQSQLAMGHATNLPEPIGGAIPMIPQAPVVLGPLQMQQVSPAHQSPGFYGSGGGSIPPVQDHFAQQAGASGVEMQGPFAPRTLQQGPFMVPQAPQPGSFGPPRPGPSFSPHQQSDLNVPWQQESSLAPPPTWNSTIPGQGQFAPQTIPSASQNQPFPQAIPSTLQQQLPLPVISSGSQATHPAPPQAISTFPLQATSSFPSQTDHSVPPQANPFTLQQNPQQMGAPLSAQQVPSRMAPQTSFHPPAAPQPAPPSSSPHPSPQKARPIPLQDSSFSQPDVNDQLIDDLGFGNMSLSKEKAPTEQTKAELQKEQPKTERKGVLGFISGLFGGRSGEEINKPTKANLGEPSSYRYDKEQGKWVDTKEGQASQNQPTLPPPPPSTSSSSFGTPQGEGSSPISFRRGAARSARSRYIDPLNPTTGTAPDSAPIVPPISTPAYATPFNGGGGPSAQADPSAATITQPIQRPAAQYSTSQPYSQPADSQFSFSGP